MNTHTKLSERAVETVAIFPQDINGGAVTSSYFSAAKSRIFKALGFAKAVAATKKITLELLQATDSSGTGAKALGAAIAVTNTTGSAKDLTAVAEARVEEMDVAGGFSHVAVRISTDNGATLLAAAVFEQGDLRYT